MRLKPTMPARAKNRGARFGQTEARIQALANDDAVCPLGNDHEPGFLPMTSASTMRANGRRRRKKDLIGYSTIHVARTTLGSKRLIATHECGTRARYATSVPMTQIQPPVAMMARPHARLSSAPVRGPSLMAR